MDLWKSLDVFNLIKNRKSKNPADTRNSLQKSNAPLWETADIQPQIREPNSPFITFKKVLTDEGGEYQYGWERLGFG